MKNAMEYKDYIGSAEYSDDDGVFFGKVQFVRALISYEGGNVQGLRKDFHAAVNEYLSMCESKGIQPEQPFKGTFNVRVGGNLHRKLAIEAEQRGISLNSLIVERLARGDGASAL